MNPEFFDKHVRPRQKADPCATVNEGPPSAFCGNPGVSQNQRRPPSTAELRDLYRRLTGFEPPASASEAETHRAMFRAEAERLHAWFHEVRQRPLAE